MAMMEEVEGDGEEAIIVKDMSRLGRDYLKAGQVVEILRQRGVRLIAINDNIGTEKGDNGMTLFLNIMYERFPSIQKFYVDAGYRGTFVSDLKEQLDFEVDISEKIKPRQWYTHQKPFPLRKQILACRVNVRLIIVAQLH
ncbi:MAG: recombinase family protein [Oscillospiraceae bacterium]|jgi:hypothetical protein|nr:recombinase family protein [Oscillospiraceae bacterium]